MSNTRNISKASMKLNDALSRMEVNPETYEVRTYGELLICEPATVLPIDQRYFLFWILVFLKPYFLGVLECRKLKDRRLKSVLADSLKNKTKY